MSPVKKIFFLCLSLILLIVLCVNSHLEKLTKKSSVELEPVSNTIVNVEKEEIKETIKEEETLQEEIVNEEIKEESETPKDTTTLNEEKVEVQKEITQEIKEEETSSTIVEEKTEDEPLITTDKRYKRTGNEKPIEELSINTQLLQIRIRDYVTKYPIVFQNSSNEISKKSLNTISTVVKMLKNHPNLKIEIAGHTDAAGTKKYNLGVSIGRAVAVKKQMIAYGFNKNKIKARGYGEEIPLVENNAEGYSRVNRRVEFNIVEE